MHLEQQRRRIEEGSDRRESRDEKHRWPQANKTPEDIRSNRNIPLPLKLTKKRARNKKTGNHKEESDADKTTLRRRSRAHVVQNDGDNSQRA